ncbi:MAG TPA: hypothetical protein VGI44_14115 [Acidimicrobiales bacterium]
MPETLDPLGPALGARDSGEWRQPLPLHVTASLVGGYRWIEQRLFELLGGWAAEATRPELRVHLDAQSVRHAWHASMWADRLPVRDGVSADELTVAPSAAARVLDVLGQPASGATGAETTGSETTGSETTQQLAALYRVVLPRLVTGYSDHLRASAPVSDGPVIRALRLVLTDEIEDWHAGERLVQGLLVRPDDVALVSARQQKLESVVVEASTSAGLTGWPP